MKIRVMYKIMDRYRKGKKYRLSTFRRAYTKSVSVAHRMLVRTVWGEQ